MIKEVFTMWGGLYIPFVILIAPVVSFLIIIFFQTLAEKIRAKKNCRKEEKDTEEKAKGENENEKPE